MNGSMDCREFLDAGFRYNHAGTDTQNVDYLPLFVETDSKVTEGAARSNQGESIYLELNVLGAADNSPPTIKVQDSQPIRVAQYSVKLINSDILSAADDNTKDKFLVINVTSALSPEDNGFFFDIKDRGNMLTSFTQENILSNKIAYHPPTNVPHDREKEVSLEFVAVDNSFASSDTATLKFIINPVKTNSPKVLLNRRLVVIEGGFAAITLDNLNIVDSDNLDQVEVHVKGGLKHGLLEVGGNKATMFTVKDLETHQVVYRHDDGDSVEDKLFLRITDGKHSTRDKLIITIIPVDDSPPYIVTNLPGSVKSGGFMQITRYNLNANDKDVSLRGITYIIKSPPNFGEVVKRHTALTRGRRVTSFTQADINHGLIYYQHHGGEGHTLPIAPSQNDHIEFRLLDNNDPPNKSGMYTFEINIAPSSNMSPHPLEDIRMQISVNETDSFVFTKDILAYEDVEDIDGGGGDSLLYTITSQPYFLTSQMTLEAGRLIRLDNDIIVMGKCQRYQTMMSFSQRDVDDEKIAYQPPCESIGPISRHVQFQFAVCNQHKSCIMDQVFDITILPFNDRVSHFSVSALKVKAGGTIRLNPDDLLSYDPGVQNNELLLLAIEREPTHGQLVMNNVKLTAGEPFSIDDLRDSDIRYFRQ